MCSEIPINLFQSIYLVEKLLHMLKLKKQPVYVSEKSIC